MKWVCLLTLIMSLNVHHSAGLRNVYLEVPEAASRGSRVSMRCHYELENEVLYSVKWYRGEREFCRYSPKDQPPLKVFVIPGIAVDRSATDGERLTISSATSVAHGRYTCEVSAEAPSFQTSMVTAYMHVVDLPTAGPEVWGVRSSYRAGMTLRAECEVHDSRPAANLSFYVNREPATMGQVWHSVEVSSSGLSTARSTIQFLVHKTSFKRNRIKVQCRATIYSAYYRSVEVSAEEEDADITSTSSTTDKPRLRLRQARVHREQRAPPPAEITICFVTSYDAYSVASRQNPIQRNSASKTTLWTILLLMLSRKLPIDIIV